MPIIILALSAFVHFWKFGFPSSIVFDEVHFGKFVSDYWHGTFFFDVHPPFSRLLIALSGHIMGVDSISTDWAHIGAPIDPSVTLLRLLPTIAGTLLPLIVYLICSELKLSKWLAGGAAMLVIFENSLVAHSRFIMQESMMILFGFMGIWLYLKHSRTGRPAWLWLSAVSVAASISSKWLGLSYLAVILALEAWNHALSHHIRAVDWRKASYRILRTAGAYVVAAVLIYSSSFAIHFALLPNSGRGDGFMSKGFQKTLVGNRYHDDPAIEAPGFIGSLIETNKQIFKSQKTITTPHSSGTRWYTWPFMTRGVYFWHSSDWSPLKLNGEIYLLGNPVIYWLGTISVALVGLFVLRVSSRRTSASSAEKRIALLVLFGYLINLLPYAFIGRVLFLYHYETALVLSIIATIFMLHLLIPEKKQPSAVLMLVGIAALLFIYFSPLTYGTPITTKQVDARMWLSTWR